MITTREPNRATIPRPNRSRGPETTSFNACRASPFLNALVIEHGPISLLERFFVKADAAAAARGVTLRFATLEELDSFNRHNNPDWPLLPMFRPRDGWQSASKSSLCVLGANAHGDIVATQAARFYNWDNTTLRDEAESRRLFYNNVTPPPDAACLITAPNANRIYGRVVYSGAGWYRPDFRGRLLSAILPRISRALALSRWNTDFTISFTDWRLVEKGVVARYGYRDIEDGVYLKNIVGDVFKGAVASMPKQVLLYDLECFLADFDRGK
jgi:hypothetical protein